VFVYAVFVGGEREIERERGKGERERESKRVYV